MINTSMVTHYNNDLVGAMGIGNLFMDLFMAIFSFLSVVCSIVVSQAIGVRNKIVALKAMHQSLFLIPY